MELRWTKVGAIQISQDETFADAKIVEQVALQYRENDRADWQDVPYDAYPYDEGNRYPIQLVAVK